MRLQPPRSPVQDPFFEALRRRHPDVDVVLLRPDPPPPEAGRATGDEGVADVLERARDALDQVRDLVAGPVDGLAADPRLGHAGPGEVVARVRASAPAVAGVSALGALRRGLPALGWEVRGGGQATPVLVARRGPVQLRTTYADATGTFLVEITSDPVPVGAARARELVAP